MFDDNRNLKNNKKLLKATSNKKKKHNKILISARRKLNSIEIKIFEALVNDEICHEEFMTIINEENKYQELKERFRMMNIQRSDAEKNDSIEEGKKRGITEVIKLNKIINNSLKPEV